MPEPDTLTSLESAIRTSVGADSFAQAQSLLVQYVAEVERELRALPAGPGKLRELEIRTGRFFEWLGPMVLASRQFSAAELARLQLIRGYHEPAGPAPPTATEA
jgi:hypothetical protein